MGRVGWRRGRKRPGWGVGVLQWAYFSVVSVDECLRVLGVAVAIGRFCVTLCLAVVRLTVTVTLRLVLALYLAL